MSGFLYQELKKNIQHTTTKGGCCMQQKDIGRNGDEMSKEEINQRIKDK